MVFERFHFFHLFTNLMSGGRVLGVVLESVGSLGDTFSDFWGSWKQVGIFMYFGIPPGSPKVESTENSWAQENTLNQRIQYHYCWFWDYTSTDDLITVQIDLITWYLNTCNGAPQPGGPRQAGAGGFRATDMGVLLHGSVAKPWNFSWQFVGVVVVW